METKICNICHKELPVEDFGICRSAKDGRQYTCKMCMREANKERREKYKKLLGGLD